MEVETCGHLPLSKDFMFSEFAYVPEGEYESDKGCLLKQGHKDEHLCFLKWKDCYILWRPVVVGLDFTDMCEECPWYSDANLAIDDECTCMFMEQISKQEAETLISIAQHSEE